MIPIHYSDCNSCTKLLLFCANQIKSEMKNILRIGLLILGTCMISDLHAQSVVSFMGGDFESPNMKLNFSAGEVISGGFSGSTMSLAGGFTSREDVIATSNETLSDELPTVFRLNQNYPNPFNPSTNITYDLPKASEVRMEVFNAIGAQVAVLTEGYRSAGTHNVKFNASGYASGMYFYRLIAAGKVISTKKMLLIK